MARRRGDKPDAYTFDLEPDGPEADDPAPEDFDPVPEHPDGSVLRGAGRRLQAFLRGRRLVAVVVGAALALTALVVDTVGDRGRISALRVAPGGVLDLVDRPRELWHVPAEGGRAGGLAGVLDDVVVVQHRDSLLGIDPADGTRRWRAPLPDAASTCGPGMDLWAQSFQLAPADRIVCVSATGGTGGDDDPDVEADTHQRSTVTVVDADGTVLASRTVMASHTMLFPGPDGGLVVAEWVGEARGSGRDRSTAGTALEGLTIDELMAGGSDPGIEDGHDLRIRLEDAATGEERWHRRVPFDGSVDPSLCVRWSEDGEVSGVDLRGGVQTLVREDLLWVAGCGIDAWLTGAGDRLDRADDPTTFEGYGVWPLGADGFVAQEEGDPGGLEEDGREPVARLLGPDGERLRTLDGRYLWPLSTDGGGDDVRLLRRDDEVVAVDADGEELWTSDLAAAALPVRTSQVAVVVDDRREVHGVDLRSGQELWSRDDVFDGVESAYSLGFSPGVVDAAFTDGRTVVLVLADGAQGDLVHWLAVDVTTGEDRWSQQTESEQWGVHLAVDGHLLRWSPTELVGLG